MPSLFDPLHVGDLVLPNRVILSPLSRRQAGPGGVPTPAMAEYYAQRSTAGLILSEGVPVAAPLMGGYEGVPGLWSEEQAAGWLSVTGAVKRAGGRMFAQLWHTGRTPDPRAGNPPPADLSAQPLDDLTVLADFRAGLRRAKAAGFDGVEIQGAKGYLADTLRGETPEAARCSAIERARLVLEVVDAAIAVWGAGRVGFHFGVEPAPYADGEEAARLALAAQLGRRNIAFLFGRQRPTGSEPWPRLKAFSKRPYIAGAGFDGPSAAQAIQEGWADAVAFGVAFVANPDLPYRLKIGASLNEADPSTFRSSASDDYAASLGLTG